MCLHPTRIAERSDGRGIRWPAKPLRPADERSVTALLERPVVAVLDDESVGAEAKQGCPCKRRFLPPVDEHGAILDRGAIGVHEWLAESALGLALLFGEDTADVRTRVLRLAERVRAKVGVRRIEGGDRFDVLGRPRPRPCIRPAARAVRASESADLNVAPMVLQSRKPKPYEMARGPGSYGAPKLVETRR